MRRPVIRILTGLLILISIILMLYRIKGKDPGKIVYDRVCQNCHLEDGQGIGLLIPPLDGDYLGNHREELPCLIYSGMNDSLKIRGSWYSQPMPGNPDLTEIEILNVLNYILKKHGKNTELFSISELRILLQNCGDPVLY